jgi:hypothetical protein
VIRVHPCLSVAKLPFYLVGYGSGVDGGAYGGTQGPGKQDGEGFSAAGGDDENVVGAQGYVFGFAS